MVTVYSDGDTLVSFLGTRGKTTAESFFSICRALSAGFGIRGIPLPR